MDEICSSTHIIFKSLPRFSFPFSSAEIPQNGIYILFEEGETGHGTDRIVRIGTHTGPNQLRNRLQQHFLKEKKDRSIFRKNIGRALLSRDDDPRLWQWELDLTSSKNRDLHALTVDEDWQRSVEKRVSEIIRDRFHFAVLEVAEKSRRLHIEARLVSTVSHCKLCNPSKEWLGSHSPRTKIRESGLWQVNELYKTPLSHEDLEDLWVRLGG